MQTIAAKLAGILQKVERPGDFYTAGTAAVLPPQLEVEGVGVIALPLLDVQAEQLIAAAERAPYGRGAETVHDEKVRRTWQIDASRVRIVGRRWQKSLNALVAEAAAGLGVAEPVAAEFYKLLVYGEGDFFVSHRDTEKCPGMFATLVIVLPSIYTGGALVVRHQGREVTLDMRCEDPSEAAFAAFYADCVHEVLPIASGRRLTLIYNLRRAAGGALPEAPDYRGEQDELAQLLQRWAAGDGAQDALTEKLIYPLQHAYTPAELSFGALKGADAAAAAVLKGAAARSGCELHLALISIEESGIAEHTGYYGSRWGRSSDDEEEFEAVEVCDRSATLSHWLRADEAPTPLKEIPFDESEVCPPGSLDDMEPDEEHFHEATGNEGASFERTYQRAALAIWPEARKLAVFNQAGLNVTLPYLEDLTARWEASGAQSGDEQWREADELCGYMLESWPVHRWHPRKDDASSKESRMLLLLARLKNRLRIDAFLGNVTAAGAFASTDAEAAVQALCLLPDTKAGELIEQIIAGNAERALSACGRLLACSVGRVASLSGAAASLVAALPPDAAKSPPPVWGEQPRPVKPGFAADLIAALDRIDPALAERATSHMLAWPKTFGFDAVLVPAVIELAVRSEGEESEAALRLRKACLDHLQARIGLALEPPSDWRRSRVVSCTCQYCQELNAFLADSGRRAWTFKAAEAKRRHLQEVIRQDRCDLDLATEKRGSPHGLVCTKNQASYDRRARQRKADLENFDRLKSRKAERTR
jgi:predicted 2-oxoglutarate/Fe(II)-dependent dioxygenase YbiX